MASPQLHLLELLQIEGVRSETYAVFTALLERCSCNQRLSDFVLQSVGEQLQEQCHPFNLATLRNLVDSTSRAAQANRAKLRAALLSPVADALNHESYRWMTDFLLIAIGKRSHQHRICPSHPSLQGTIYDVTPPNRDLGALWHKLRLRDGPGCCVSGAVHNVTYVQLIPISDDVERLARFKVLAQVFFQEGASLSDEVLRSPQNAMMLSMYWKDRLDKGHLIFKYVDGEFHAVPPNRDDADGLTMERRANGIVTGPSRMQLYEGRCPNDYPLLNPKLVQLHQALIETWRRTGLAECLLENIEWVNSMPKKMQSTRFLDPHDFGALLKHKLALM